MSLLSFTFTKIVVNDLDAAERFYCDVIGLKLVAAVPATEGDYAQDERVLSVSGTNDGPMLLLIRYLHRPTPQPGEAWTGFIVSDVDAAAAAVEQAGGGVVIPCHTVEQQGVRVAIVTDPEGHMIELVTMLPAA